MPTATPGPWLDTALAKGLIAPASKCPNALPPDISEKAFMSAVVALAERAGWLVYHTHDSRRSAAGFPDLVLVRDGVLICAELKTDRGRLGAEQDTWLIELSHVRGARTYVWRPRMWDQIVQALTGGGVQS